MSKARVHAVETDGEKNKPRKGVFCITTTIQQVQAAVVRVGRMYFRVYAILGIPGDPDPCGRAHQKRFVILHHIVAHLSLVTGAGGTRA